MSDGQVLTTADGRPVPDWHRLAETTAVPKPRRRGASAGRADGVRRPGQLSFGDLPLPAATPIDGHAHAHAHAHATRPDATVAAAATDRRGVLVSGRFPETVRPSASVRPRPADWSGPGVMPRTVAFALPPPAVPEEPDHDPTLPVYATKELEQRLSRLRVGQTITVEPGEYRGTLTIRTAVTIRAAGGEVRIRSTTGPAVCVKGCGATLTGLTLRSDHSDAIVVESPAGRSGAAGNSLAAGHLDLDGCRLTAARSGIVLGTALVRLGVERCRIVAGDGSAIRLPMGAVAAVAGSEMTSAHGPGISGDSGVTLAISASTIVGCGGAGVRLGEGASLWMDDGEPSAITGNLGSGIALGRGGRGALAGTTLTGNGGWGLVAPAGDVLVRGGTVKGNVLGDISR